MLFRPSESSKRIADTYRRYLLTTFATNNEVYNSQLEKALQEPGAIESGPYISMSDPFEKGKTLRQLAAEGVVSPEILKLQEFAPDRPLYSHQEAAVRMASEGKNIVITTGTGSGKTEAFLIPVINQLLREKEAGTLGPGVRTLIIYPMNALVNDQIRRLRDILRDMDGDNKITFGRFTGETEEKFEEAYQKYTEIEDLEKYPLLDNEIICREKMRQEPPNILITNYAMMEYLLLRPGDNVIFGDQNAQKWKTVVFDEAHSYNGAKGIEVSALIRRVKAMLNRQDIQFILTSATLGDERADGDILKFAGSLCTADFQPGSVIRSHTVEAKPVRELQPLDFAFYRELAELIRNNEDNDILLEKIRTFSDLPGENAEKLLYEIILHDSFYYRVRKVLFNQIRSLDETAGLLQITPQELTDFIAVASAAVRREEPLFDARYHMFLRGIEGIYITLPPSNRLFIHKMQTYLPESVDENDIGYRVFQVSFCHNCGALYIAGQEEDGHLIQKSKFNDAYDPDVFLLSNELDEEIDDSQDTKNRFQICAKCGAIKHATSVNGLQCGHGSENVVRLTRVKEHGTVLNSCPCCHSVNSRRSILRPYYLGSEAVTAVIATALYNELPGEYHHIRKKTAQISDEDDPFGFDELIGDDEQETDEVEMLPKQFLTFSDNRQMAAYFASYLQDTYTRTLVKRLMQQIVEEAPEKFDAGVPLPSFVNMLQEKFSSIGMFSNESAVDAEKQAWIYTLKEMSNIKAKDALYKKGSLYFTLDMEPLPLKNIQLTPEENACMVQILCRCMMQDAAVITPFDEKFSLADQLEFSVAEVLKGYIDSGNKEEYDTDQKIHRSRIGWVPEPGHTNARLKYAARILEKDEAFCRRYLSGVWMLLKNRNYIREKNFGKHKVFMLDTARIQVKRVRQLWKCTECKAITPYQLRGKCENAKCNGHLAPYNAERELENDHYYNLYHHLSPVPMVVKEHTAQLSSNTAYEYQNRFKKKEINVLSCSTTFEMGVDVGSLETVFMRNVPPTPANYAQRAGRAGRRLRSAAYAVTYCPNTSHDLNFFRNPRAMIRGTIRPPQFNVSNDKIILRHIFASAFSFFWRAHPELFKREIGEFMDADGFSELKKYLNQHPQELRDYLKKVVPADLQAYFEINEFGWIRYMFDENGGVGGLCDIVESRYREDIEKLEEHKSSNSYTIHTIRNQNAIGFLSGNNLIPKYGFPVDTVALQGNRDGVGANLRLNRDLFSAISEYAPGSEIVADGKLLKSRYVRKLTGYAWPKYHYSVCPECLTLNRTPSWEEAPSRCRQCGKPIHGHGRQYIIPRFGFQLDLDAPQKVGLNKPERTYKGAISYIGMENQIVFQAYDVCGHRVLVGNSKMDSLAVLNESPFYVCDVCGYTEVHEEAVTPFIPAPARHKNPRGYSCNGKNLTRYSLGHEFKTDVVMIKFVDEPSLNVNQAWTILYALLEGLSRYIQVERTELSGCLQWYRQEGTSNFGFILFDNTPGGAGYVRRLEDPQVFAAMMQEGFRVVRNCTCGGAAADTACYGCLCNYYNQKQHDILKRKYALEFFSSFSETPEGIWAHLQEDAADQPVPSSVESAPEPMQLNVYRAGQNQISETAESIWENLLEDCEEEEAEAIRQIMSRGRNNIERPYYQEEIEIPDTKERFFVNLIWKSSKVMLFLQDCTEDFKTARKTGWHCYSTTENFDVDQFLSEIEV